MRDLLNSESSELFKEYSNFNFDVFQRLDQLITDIIDVAESRKEDRICVKKGVSSEIDKLKDTFQRLDIILSEIAEQLIKDLQYDGSLSCVYFPQLGFLLAVPQNELNPIPENEMDLSV